MSRVSRGAVIIFLMLSDLQKYCAFTVYLVVVFFAILWALQPQRDFRISSMSEEERAQAANKTVKSKPYVDMAEEEKTPIRDQAQEIIDQGTTKAFGHFVNAVHEGTGTVSVVEFESKNYIVLQNDFRTEAGPDLHVVLSALKDPQKSEDLHNNINKDVGALQTVSGAQVYALDETFDAEIQSVVIYCVPFRVIFTYANVI